MIKLAVTLLLPAFWAFPARAAETPSDKKPAVLSWQGQSCFYLVTPGGQRVMMDPIPDSIGYKPAALPADLVTISHEHFDHTNVGLALGKPLVLRGLKRTGKDEFKAWQQHDRRLGDLHVYNVPVYHDDQRGAKRGLNSVFVFETGGLRLAHLGDLGHVLTAAQVKAIGRLDVLMIPVGGFYTIDAAMAKRVVDQLRPKAVVLPMHYRTDVLTIKELAAVDAFLEAQPRVDRVAGNRLTLDAKALEGPARVVVLGYKPAPPEP